jgi:hypothetical protein
MIFWMLICNLIVAAAVGVLSKQLFRGYFFRSVLIAVVATAVIQVGAAITGNLNGNTQMTFALFGFVVSMGVVIWASRRPKKTPSPPILDPEVAKETIEPMNPPRSKQAFRMVPTDRPRVSQKSP